MKLCKCMMRNPTQKLNVQTAGQILHVAPICFVLCVGGLARNNNVRTHDMGTFQYMTRLEQYMYTFYFFNLSDKKNCLCMLPYHGAMHQCGIFLGQGTNICRYN